MTGHPENRIYPWGHPKPYNDFSGFLKTKFGHRVQKLSIDAGFTCPNRDGTKGVGGCTFCNNQSFNPGYCSSGISITEQIESGKAFFSRRYPSIKYLAYFQAYTNTYAAIDRLIPLYEEALEHPDICGLVIGTRPDCVSNDLLSYFEELAHRTYLAIEFGIESTLDKTLLRINRGHDFQTGVKAIYETSSRGISVGVHMILGLPGESQSDMLGHAKILGALPIRMLKLHQLQIIRGTAIEIDLQENPGDFNLFSLEDYVDTVIRFLELLNPEIIVERFASASPPDLIAGSRWGLKNFEVVSKIEKEMVRRGTWQGRLFKPV